RWRRQDQKRSRPKTRQGTDSEPKPPPRNPQMSTPESFSCKPSACSRSAMRRAPPKSPGQRMITSETTDDRLAPRCPFWVKYMSSWERLTVLASSSCLPSSVGWFERGAAALRAQIQTLTDALESRPLTRDEQEAAINEKRRKLADTLCAVAEVYMTDLSWEDDAESRCEALITEAIMLAPEQPDTWQTVANVRISQSRTEEAKEALKRSLGLWTDLPPEDPGVPAFPSRVSLVRLLIEVGLEEQAIEVAGRLVDEDDLSVEAWYLGGYGKYMLGQKLKEVGQTGDADKWKSVWRSSRKWLIQCMRIFEAEEYEDERLGEHARELMGVIRDELGEALGDDLDEDVWEDTDDEADVDTDMQ
ncbi:uncharacterized protein PODANS_1_14170, partial [Podospora anserina S mat+]